MHKKSNQMSITTSSAIDVSALCKTFGKITAVENLSFRVPSGSVTALLGGNGAGKTTTISMLLGLILATSGTIHLLGLPMPKAKHRILPRVNFQSPYADLPKRLTVRENLMVYGRLYGLADVKGRISVLAEELALADLLNRPAGELSAGQKTRVGLAKSLINEPELLLLDEPTASLDPDTADWVRGYLEQYQARTGATILLASHNMAEVERLATQVLMMKGGRVVDEGSPSELIAKYGHKNLEEVFLDIARRGSPLHAEATA